jgi:subtilisin family serine protease
MYNEALLRLAGIDHLMQMSQGSAQLIIALIDGLADTSHPEFSGVKISTWLPHEKSDYGSVGTDHATMIASMLVAKGPSLLGICSNCSLLNIAIADKKFERSELSPLQVAKKISLGIKKAVEEGADIIQISMEFSSDKNIAFDEVYETLRWASQHRVITVISAGNRSSLGLSKIYSAPNVIPVGMLDHNGIPHTRTSFGNTMALRGLMAPGEGIYGAMSSQPYGTASGSSYAASFVTGTLALLKSFFSNRTNEEILFALLQNSPINPAIHKKLNGNHAYHLLK